MTPLTLHIWLYCETSRVRLEGYWVRLEGCLRWVTNTEKVGNAKISEQYQVYGKNTCKTCQTFAYLYKLVKVYKLYQLGKMSNIWIIANQFFWL